MDVDIAVVGAGPAGLSAAFCAAQQGARVAVFEKSKEIGYPIHTSGGSWIEELRALNVPDRFMHPIHEGHFIAPTKTAIFRYDTAISCVLDVRGLYQFLAELASAQGAQIVINSTITGPLIRNGTVAGVKVRKRGRVFQCRAKIVIDASGVNAVVARDLGVTAGCERIGIGAEYDLYAPNWPQQRASFLFGSRFAPSGYAWVFPHGQGRVRVGVGIIRPDCPGDPRDYLEKVCEELKPELGAFSALEYHVGTIPSSGSCPETVRDGFMVVGDAGGLISTLLGEGIRFSIDIGRMAGKVAADAIHNQRSDREFLMQYDKAWKKKYAKTFRVGLDINRRISKYSDQKWDEKIAALSRLDPRFLPAILKGDFRSKTLFEIVLKNPGLVSSVFYKRLKSTLKNT